MRMHGYDCGGEGRELAGLRSVLGCGLGLACRHHEVTGAGRRLVFFPIRLSLRSFRVALECGGCLQGMGMARECRRAGFRVEEGRKSVSPWARYGRMGGRGSMSWWRLW